MPDESRIVEPTGAPIERELEKIRSKWATSFYQRGVQAAGNYIHQDDALVMIDLLEKYQIPLDGFETFRLFPDGGVQPDTMLSMDYFPEISIPVGQTPYSDARARMEKLAEGGEVFHFQIIYDSARQFAEDVRAGRAKRPDNWPTDWDKKSQP